MIRQSDLPKLMTAGLQTIFMTAAQTYSPIYPMMTTEVPSTKESEVYDRLSSTPSLREWKAERAPKALLENGFTLKNKDYETSISVNKNAMKDDQYGQIKIRVQ